MIAIVSRRATRLGLVAGAAVSLFGGCAVRSVSSDSFLGVITPYRIDIVQGSVVTKEQAAAVRPGMGREQVRDILGSPMLADPFHADRWDYVFSIRRQGTEPQRRSVVAHFNKAGRLERLDVPEALPSENEFVASILAQRAKPTERVLELTEAQRKALPVPERREASAAPTISGPSRPYPPLEPQ
jgi:outer membrane protein assembly factor BamE